MFLSSVFFLRRSNEGEEVPFAQVLYVRARQLFFFLATVTNERHFQDPQLNANRIDSILNSFRACVGIKCTCADATHTRQLPYAYIYIYLYTVMAEVFSCTQTCDAGTS